MKIWKLSQINSLEEIDQKVLNKIKETVEALNENYGESRTVDSLGGYVLLSTTTIQAFENFIKQYPTAIPEFIDYFMGVDGTEYVEVLFLLSSDYSVMVYLNAHDFKNNYQDLIFLCEE
ncbi:hypothetical protein GMB50_10560 [Turicibacter sanguinis]|nr:hypothetical protein [Turicibacter sanguinis]MTP47961.1 hypothetical protein [Turicibacter sanguinis]MTP50709.1 hypothetical protein [Turicibacter sanguinis]MTQ07945.1 hypothetical protein [Turicibacter sanguinis]